MKKMSSYKEFMSLKNPRVIVFLILFAINGGVLTVSFIFLSELFGPLSVDQKRFWIFILGTSAWIFLYSSCIIAIIAAKKQLEDVIRKKNEKLIRLHKRLNIMAFLLYSSLISLVTSLAIFCYVKSLYEPTYADMLLVPSNPVGFTITFIFWIGVMLMPAGIIDLIYIWVVTEPDYNEQNPETTLKNGKVA